MLLYTDLTGEVHIEAYHELLSKPYVRSIQARSLRNPPADLIENSTAFVDELRTIKHR